MEAVQFCWHLYAELETMKDVVIHGCVSGQMQELWRKAFCRLITAVLLPSAACKVSTAAMLNYSLFHKYGEVSEGRDFKIHWKSEMRAPVIKNHY